MIPKIKTNKNKEDVQDLFKFMVKERLGLVDKKITREYIRIINSVYGLLLANENSDGAFIREFWPQPSETNKKNFIGDTTETEESCKYGRGLAVRLFLKWMDLHSDNVTYQPLDVNYFKQGTTKLSKKLSKKLAENFHSK